MADSKFDIGRLLRRINSRSDRVHPDWVDPIVPVVVVGDASRLCSDLQTPASLYGCKAAGAGGVGMHDSFQVHAKALGGCLVTLYRNDGDEVWRLTTHDAVQIPVGAILTGQIAGNENSACEVKFDQMIDKFDTTDGPGFYSSREFPVGPFFVPHLKYWLIQATSPNTVQALTLKVEDLTGPPLP